GGLRRIVQVGAAVLIMLPVAPDARGLEVLLSGVEAGPSALLPDLDGCVGLALMLGRSGVIGFQPVIVCRPGFIEGLVVGGVFFNSWIPAFAGMTDQVSSRQ
ncbi:MAG: hypothetical protein QF659_10875, partial [Dehalococcoidia bacterium]|nr:hypothetical protein [Dehalococcoidia bacterium]